MNAFTFATIVLYFGLGLLLSASGIGVFDKPLNFIGILLIVTLIDIVSFIRAKG